MGQRNSEDLRLSYKIRISRQWECSPRGGALVTFSAGDYLVPDDISDYLAQRCLRSGLGKLVEDAKQEPRRQANKMRRGAPENKSAA